MQLLEHVSYLEGDLLFIELGVTIYGNSVPEPVLLCLAKSRKCRPKTHVACKGLWQHVVELGLDGRVFLSRCCSLVLWAIVGTSWAFMGPNGVWEIVLSP